MPTFMMFCCHVELKPQTNKFRPDLVSDFVEDPD